MPECPLEKLSINSLRMSSWLPKAQPPWDRLDMENWAQQHSSWVC